MGYENVSLIRSLSFHGKIDVSQRVYHLSQWHLDGVGSTNWAVLLGFVFPFTRRAVWVLVVERCLRFFRKVLQAQLRILTQIIPCQFWI